jgi:hypothetical protein
MGAFIYAVITSMVFAGVCVPFLNVLKTEAPTLYQSFGAPTAMNYLWNRKLLMPFSSMILFRRYREVLAPYPKSRAWASWLFFAHWLQLSGLLVFLIAMLY